MNLLPEGFTPEYSQAKGVEQLVDKFNRGDLDYLPTKDKEQIAMLAAQYGRRFDVGSKPIKKGLFDMVDTALFGLVPNEWRPKTIGEDYFGESRSDKIAGGVGTVGGAYLGIRTGIGLAGKASGKVKGLWDTWRYPSTGGASAASSGNKISQLNRGRDIPLLGSGAPRLGQGAPRLGQGAPRLPGRPTLLGMGTRRPITTGAGETYDIMRGF